MANKRKIVLYFILVGLLLILYFLYGRNTFELYLQNGNNEFINQLITHFYPRFLVEKSRFSNEFFLNKLDQFLIRILFSFTTIFLFYYFKIITYFIHKEALTTQFHGKILHWIYFTYLLYIVKDWWWLYEDLDKLSVFYVPIKIISFLPYPPLVLTKALILIMLIGAMLSIIYQKWWAKLLTLLIFNYLQALFFSFNKIDHGYLLFNYVGMIFIFWNQDLKWNQKLLVAILLVVCLTYSFAGLEKLFSSGITWAEANNFRVFLQLHSNDLSNWISTHYLLCVTLPFMAFMLQISFLLCFFVPKLRPFYIVAGVLFHLSTYFIFNIGALIHPWIITYVFFIPASFFKNGANFKNSQIPE